MFRVLLPLLLFFSLLLSSFSLAEEAAKPDAILFSSQIQGTLFSCRCPFNPEGGFSRRATIIKNLRDKYNITLVDTGGWMPGGIYDELAAGEQEVRSRATLVSSLMKKLDYDVVALSEDDFNLGNDELSRFDSQYLSGNLSVINPGSAKYLSSKTVNGITFINLFGGSPNTSLYPAARDLHIREPLPFLKQEIDRAIKQGSTIVLISQMLEKDTIKILKSVEGITLAITANRTISGRYPYKIGSTTVAGVEPLGKAAGLFELNGNFSEIRLGQGIEQSKEMVDIIHAAGYESDELESVPLDLYVMSRCPFGRKALNAILSAREKLGDKITLNLYFIIEMDKNGKFQSLHGEDEVEDDRRMLAIWLAKKDALLPYLKESGKKDFDFATWLKNNGIDPWRIRGSLDSGEVDAELKYHSNRCQSLGVSASPTLYIAREEYPADFEIPDQVLFSICTRLKGSSKIAGCSDLPKCFSDADCYKFGYVSYCEKPGTKDAKCVYVKEDPFEVIGIRARDTKADPFEAAIIGMKTWVPSIQVQEILEDSPRAQALIKKHKITWLPAFIFPAAFEKCRNFKMLQDSFQKTETEYLAVPSTYFANTRIDRKAENASIELVISPFSQTSARFFDILCIMKKRGLRVPQIRLKVFTDRDGNLYSPRGIADLEESARMLAALKIDYEKGLEYLRNRFKNLGSSYWDDAAIAAGIAPAKLKEHAKSEPIESILKENATLCNDFATDADVFLVFNNREIIIPVDDFDFEVLMWIANP